MPMMLKASKLLVPGMRIIVEPDLGAEMLRATAICTRVGVHTSSSTGVANQAGGGQPAVPLRRASGGLGEVMVDCCEKSTFA
jgi:hypothetical protein